MADLFLNPPESTQHPNGAQPATSIAENAPLAERMRPLSLSEYTGQEHILGPGKLLRRAIEADRITSILLFGPPGTGKTSLARIIALSTHAHFEPLSGVENSVADIRRALNSAAERQRANAMRTIVFIDEIHRLNKAQQDVLLPDVEKGAVRLIGATTHNPYFVLTSALVSRSQVFQLEPIRVESLVALQQRAIADTVRGLGAQNITADTEALEHLAIQSEGDARKTLNALELAALTTPRSSNGTISALIKSVRGCDPDAALYWLARMLVGGEDIRFLARRLVILASEDVGMADPQALPLAIAAQQAVEFIGLPEAQIPLAHAAVYLATAPKSNRAYAGILAAKKDVESGVTLPVPLHLRDGKFAGAKKLGYTGYQYSHDFDGAYVPQAYLSEGRRYYTPSENGAERRVKERLEYWRALFEEAQAKTKS
jgi:putative ATPase